MLRTVQQLHVLRTVFGSAVALVQQEVVLSLQAPKSRNGIKLRATGQRAGTDDMAQLVTVLLRKAHATQEFGLIAIGIEGYSLCIASLLILTNTARIECFCYHHKNIRQESFRG